MGVSNAIIYALDPHALQPFHQEKGSQRDAYIGRSFQVLSPKQTIKRVITAVILTICKLGETTT